MIGRGSWPASLRRLCWLPKAWARCSGHPNVPTSPFSKSQQIKSPKVGKWRLLKGETLKPWAMAELWSAAGHANMWTKAKESLTCTSRFSKDSSHWTETAGWNSRSKTAQGPEHSHWRTASPITQRWLLLPHPLEPSRGGRLKDTLKSWAFIPKRQFEAQHKLLE